MFSTKAKILSNSLFSSPFTHVEEEEKSVGTRIKKFSVREERKVMRAIRNTKMEEEVIAENFTVKMNVKLMESYISISEKVKTFERDDKLSGETAFISSMKEVLANISEQMAINCEFYSWYTTACSLNKTTEELYEHYLLLRNQRPGMELASFYDEDL